PIEAIGSEDQIGSGLRSLCINSGGAEFVSFHRCCFAHSSRNGLAHRLRRNSPPSKKTNRRRLQRRRKLLQLRNTAITSTSAAARFTTRNVVPARRSCCFTMA